MSVEASGDKEGYLCCLSDGSRRAWLGAYEAKGAPVKAKARSNVSSSDLMKTAIPCFQENPRVEQNAARTVNRHRWVGRESQGA